MILISKVFFRRTGRTGSIYEDEMLERSDSELRVTGLGKVFNRHICRVFDNFIKNKKYKIHGTGNKDHV